MLPLPSDHFTWRTSPKFSSCKEMQNHCRNGKSPPNCKYWNMPTSGRDYVLVIIRLIIAVISFISVWKMDANIWKSKPSTTFYFIGENVYLVALFEMLRLPWCICYNRKKWKNVTKYSIKRKIAKTWVSLLKIDREWEYYKREKELDLYINGKAAEWLSAYQEKLSPLKWSVFENTLHKVSSVILCTLQVLIFTYFSYNISGEERSPD